MSLCLFVELLSELNKMPITLLKSTYCKYTFNYYLNHGIWQPHKGLVPPRDHDFYLDENHLPDKKGKFFGR